MFLAPHRSLKWKLYKRVWCSSNIISSEFLDLYPETAFSSNVQIEKKPMLVYLQKQDTALGRTKMEVLSVYQLLLMLSLTGAAASAAGSLHGCRSRCGFPLDCSTTDDGLEKLFVFNVEIVNISLPLGQVRMVNEISW